MFDFRLFIVSKSQTANFLICREMIAMNAPMTSDAPIAKGKTDQ